MRNASALGPVTVPGQSVTAATSTSPFCTPAGTLIVRVVPLGAQLPVPARYAMETRVGVGVGAEVGLDVFLICDFLEGTATLRSDVLDRLAQAVGAIIHLEPTPPQRANAPTPPQQPA